MIWIALFMKLNYKKKMQNFFEEVCLHLKFYITLYSLFKNRWIKKKDICKISSFSIAWVDHKSIDLRLTFESVWSAKFE